MGFIPANPSEGCLKRRAGSLAGVACALGLLAAPASQAATPLKLYGKIVGVVIDAGGVPQMGATVQLFDRQDRLRERVTTDEQGRFLFDNLIAGAYSIRVSLALFIPVLRSNILVQPGAYRFLNVTLAGLFSSIELVYPAPEQRALMSDDWKWVLRTSTATRPVLRFRPDWLPGPGVSTRASVPMFSETRGMLKVSAGDSGRVTSFGNESDLGTAFAVATSLFGSNQLHVAGNLGYAAQSGSPSAGFRTSYARNEHSPEVTLTMRQLFVPGRFASALTTGVGVPALKTLSLAVDDGVQISDSLRFEYGFSLDSVSFFDRLNYLSPYGRLKYALSDTEKVEFSYSSGVPRPDFAAAPASPDAALQNELTSLALFPRISLLGGRAKVQRLENFEFGYSRVLGSRTFRAAAYREAVTNAWLTIVGASGLYPAGDVLPDLFSSASVFNVGSYRSLGYMASLTQALGENLNVTMMYGSGGALLPVESAGMVGGTPDELRAMIREGRRSSVTAQVAGTSPWTGTQFAASYQWTDRRSATPTHYYVSHGLRNEAGLNVYLRQPIPSFVSLPVRMEASADLRNLMAQGYLPFRTQENRNLLLMHTPRSVRGGLSFIF